MAEFTRVVRGSRIYYEIPRTRFYRDYPYKTGIRKELVMYFVSSSEDSSAVDVLDWYDWRAPGKTVMGMSEGQILRVVELRHDRWGYTIAPIRSGVVTNGSRYRKTLDSFHIYYQPVVSFRHSEQGLYEEWMWRNQNKGKFLRLAIECTVR